MLKAGVLTGFAPSSMQVKLPLEVGTFMECEWKQGQYHRAKIIERRKRSDAPDYEYYVHYINCE